MERRWLENRAGEVREQRDVPSVPEEIEEENDGGGKKDHERRGSATAGTRAQL